MFEMSIGRGGSSTTTNIYSVDPLRSEWQSIYMISYIHGRIKRIYLYEILSTLYSVIIVLVPLLLLCYCCRILNCQYRCFKLLYKNDEWRKITKSILCCTISVCTTLDSMLIICVTIYYTGREMKAHRRWLVSKFGCAF